MHKEQPVKTLTRLTRHQVVAATELSTVHRYEENDPGEDETDDGRARLCDQGADPAPPARPPDLIKKIMPPAATHVLEFTPRTATPDSTRRKGNEFCILRPDAEGQPSSPRSSARTA